MKWRNPKHAAQFISTLETYAFPRISNLKVSEVSTADLLAVLQPIWLEKPETARRVRQRIGTIIKWAVANGWRQDKLELQPFEAPEPANEEEAKITRKIHSVLERQANTMTVENQISETELIEICDIIILGFDESDTFQSQKFDRAKKSLFGFATARQPTKELCIEINGPQKWTPDSDGNVYFEYITRATGSLEMHSTVEIPENLIRKWKADILRAQH